MKALFGSIVIAGSGSVGDVTYSRNRYGYYTKRKKPVPTSYTPAAQTIIDQRIILSRHWSTLSETQRSTWNIEARNHPRPYDFGTYRTMPGYNFFMSVNFNRWFCGQGITDVPLLYQKPEFIRGLSSQFISASSELLINWLDEVQENIYLKVWCSPNLSPGRNNANTALKLIGTYNPADDTTIDIAADYLTRFGTYPGTGTKVFVRANQVHSLSGAEGLYSNCLCVYS